LKSKHITEHKNTTLLVKQIVFFVYHIPSKVSGKKSECRKNRILYGRHDIL